MKIYTRTGDSGETGLFDGERVPKSDPRVEAYGEVDETNAAIGFAIAACPDLEISGMLAAIQRDLFVLGGRLADPRRKVANRVAKAVLSDADILRLESWIDQLEATLRPLRRFVLPGGTAGAAALHQARTVCRRAERRMVSLGSDAFEPELLAYINRLSDLLFVMARAANHRAGVNESEW